MLLRVLYIEDNGHKRVATVREAPDVNSPELVIRAFIASRAQRLTHYAGR
jgi:hypothetical protein